MRLETRYIDIEKSISIIDWNFHIDFISSISIILLIYGNTNFLVKYRHHLEPRIDGIVGKTYQTYNSLLPCQEIDITCHKLSQNDNYGVYIRVRSPPSWNSVFGTTWLRFSSRPGFRTQARNSVGPWPGVGVTKQICSVPLFSEFFSIIKTHATYWISLLYLTDVAAAQLWWHLSNINVIQII